MPTGADPEIEEGGGIEVEIGGRVDSAQLAVDVVQSTVGGSGGMLPQGNF